MKEFKKTLLRAYKAGIVLGLFFFITGVALPFETIAIQLILYSKIILFVSFAGLILNELKKISYNLNLILKITSKVKNLKVKQLHKEGKLDKTEDWGSKWEQQ